MSIQPHCDIGIGSGTVFLATIYSKYRIECVYIYKKESPVLSGRPGLMKEEP